MTHTLHENTDSLNISYQLLGRISSINSNTTGSKPLAQGHQSPCIEWSWCGLGIPEAKAKWLQRGPQKWVQIPEALGLQKGWFCGEPREFSRGGCFILLQQRVLGSNDSRFTFFIPFCFALSTWPKQKLVSSTAQSSLLGHVSPRHAVGKLSGCQAYWFMDPYHGWLSFGISGPFIYLVSPQLVVGLVKLIQAHQRKFSLLWGDT